MTWSSVNGAGAYSVGLRDLNTNILQNIPLQRGTSVDWPVTDGHQYRWDVASCSTYDGGDNTTNCPNRSGDWTFTAQTQSAPPAPTLVSPANGSTVGSSPVTLVWNSVNGAGAYSVGLRDLNTNILQNIPLQRGTSVDWPVTDGHQYRWDVASCSTYDGGDNTTNCPNRSGDWTFTAQTQSAPPAPTLVSPANGSTVGSSPVTLTWSSVNGAGAYSVGLRDLNTNILQNIPLQRGTSVDWPVTMGHQYRWDVASCSTYDGGDNTTNCTNRSGDWTFTAQTQSAPPAPTLVSPPNNSTQSGNSITLTWNSASGAQAYSVGLRDMTTNVLQNIPLQTGTSVNWPVTIGHQYRWNVASCSTYSGGDNTTNCPNRSVTWYFTMSGQSAPPAPTLISPPNNSTQSGSQITLKWNLVNGAGAYSVGLRDVGTGVLQNIPLQTGSSVSWPVTAGHQYRWNVASCSTYSGGDNTTNCPNRSATWYFTMSGQSALPAPTLISPPNNSTQSGSQITLKWNTVNGAGAYSVGLRDVNSGVLANIPLQTGGSVSWPVTAGHQYRWNVASCYTLAGGDNTTNCPNRSGTWYFTMSGQGAPPAPTLVSPPDNSTQSGSQVTLKWNTVNGAGAYSVDLRDVNSGVLANIPLQTGGSVSWPVTAGHQYRWNVASCYTLAGGDNTTNCPNRSGTWYFTMQGQSAKWMWPVPELTRFNSFQDYAHLNSTGSYTHHSALDIGDNNPHPIVAVADGDVVKFVRNDPNPNCKGNNKGSGLPCVDHGFGNTIIVRHADGAFSQYSHMSTTQPHPLWDKVQSACTYEPAHTDSNGVWSEDWVCNHGDVPPVTAGSTVIGYIGDTGYGVDDNSKYAHVHLESKRFSTLYATGDVGNAMCTLKNGHLSFAYSCQHPDLLGYIDPVINLDGATAINAKQVRITSAGDGLAMRDGPNRAYRDRTDQSISPHLKSQNHYNQAGTIYWVREQAPGVAGSGCSLGWYQVYQGDGGFPPNPAISYFLEVGADPVDQRNPDLWVCIGDGNQHWVEDVQ